MGALSSAGGASSSAVRVAPSPPPPPPPPRSGERCRLAGLFVRAAQPSAHRPRLFLPLGHDVVAARAFRAQGYATVAALSAADSAIALRCTHELRGSEAAALEEQA
jgi:hypothetical protein